MGSRQAEKYRNQEDSRRRCWRRVKLIRKRITGERFGQLNQVDEELNRAGYQSTSASLGTRSTGHELAMGLRRAYVALHRSTNASLVDCGVTADQFVVLAALLEGGPMTQTQLSQRTFSDPNTISAMLGRLQDLGCINRKRHKADGRFRVVSLTQRGRNMLGRCLHATEEVRQSMTQQLGTQSPQDFIACLNGLAASLEGSDSMSRDAE